MSDTVAKYIRLSSEDDDLGKSGKTESNSVTNQRNLLDAFISRTPELADTTVIEFCDDGWSGKNFERPAVQEMISQAREGKIQCIIVKDLSRFGRDYITVGNYISCVFPFLGVRFIAVNDGFDSIRPADIDSLETSFKTLLYDLYSRDLSRKVRSAKKFRAQRGDFLSPFAPYGYVKDPANKNRLVIDPDAAETVRRIFRLMASGKKAEQIAMILNREAVLTPMLHKRAAGCSRTRWPSIWEDNFWTDDTVVTILRDERYVGKNIYGKKMRDMVGHAHTIRVSRADWITVEDTHEGIVTREEFDRAQAAMRGYVEQGERTRHDWPLCSKVRCGVCGYAMSRTPGKKKYFYCTTPRINAAYNCADRTPENDILEAVLDGLRMQALVAVELRHLWEEQRREQKKDIAATLKSLTKLREIYQQLCQQINSLYESFALGEISKAEYLTVKASAVQQRDTAATRIAELEAALENEGTDGSLQNTFVSTFEKYTEIEKITSEIISEVLKEIHISPGERLEFVWNFQDEMKKLILDLQGGHKDGNQESMDLLPNCIPGCRRAGNAASTLEGICGEARL